MEKLGEVYSMLRSTSGMVVTIDSKLVTLPSLPGLCSTLYQGSKLLKRTSCTLPPGAVSELESVNCWACLQWSFMFSSMYANLHRGICETSLSQKKEKGQKSLHMFVYIKCICLLCKIVSAHSTPHLGHFIFWVPDKRHD